MDALDFVTFLRTAVAGIPLLFPVMGLVEFIKLFKDKDGFQLVSGNSLLLSSLLIGLVFGTGYMITVTRPPATPDWYIAYVYWFGVAIYGLAIGLVASGLYNVIKNKVEELLAGQA